MRAFIRRMWFVAASSQNLMAHALESNQKYYVQLLLDFGFGCHGPLWKYMQLLLDLHLSFNTVSKVQNVKTGYNLGSKFQNVSEISCISGGGGQVEKLKTLLCAGCPLLSKVWRVCCSTLCWAFWARPPTRKTYMLMPPITRQSQWGQKWSALSMLAYHQASRLTIVAPEHAHVQVDDIPMAIFFLLGYVFCSQWHPDGSVYYCK